MISYFVQSTEIHHEKSIHNPTSLNKTMSDNEEGSRTSYHTDDGIEEYVED